MISSNLGNFQLLDLVFDGGFSTELIRLYPEIDSDPLWSSRLLVTNTEAILKTHKSFLTAGSDAILSSTYQASIDGFRDHLGCSSDEAKGYLLKGSKLVKQARDEFWEDYRMSHPHDNVRRKPLACVSMGPYGTCLADGSEYTGSYVEWISEEKLAMWHKERLKIFVEEEPADLYVFETIPALVEVRAILTAIKDQPTCSCVVMFSCKDGEFLSHGERFIEGVKLASNSDQVVAVGINCTSPVYVESLLRSLRGLATKNIIVKPNSGEVWEGKRWRPNGNAKSISSYVPTWLCLGARWIGGCCRSTPQDVREIKKVMQSSQKPLKSSCDASLV